MKIFRDLAKLSEDRDLDGFRLPVQFQTDDVHDQYGDSLAMLSNMDAENKDTANDPHTTNDCIARFAHMQDDVQSMDDE